MRLSPRVAGVPCLVLLALGGAVAVAPPARAIAPHAPEGLVPGGAAQLSQLPFVLQATSDKDWNATRSEDPALARFVAEVGGRWVATYDKRTDRPALVKGSGMPWMPGDGNSLAWTDVLRAGETKPTSRDETLRFLEGRARRFVNQHADLFDLPVPASELVLDAVNSGGIAARPTTRGTAERAWYVTFRVRHEGVPVANAALVFRVNSGNLVQFGSARLGDALATVRTKPAQRAEVAFDASVARLEKAVGRVQASVEPLSASTLVLLPWAADPRSYTGEPGAGLAYRLAWESRFRVEGALETWVSHVDAVTGDVLTLFDDNRYACPIPASPQARVTGGVYLGAIEEVPESVRGLPFTAVVHGGPVPTDFNGLFPLTPGLPDSTALQGRFFGMTCAQCTNPVAALVSNPAGGNLSLGLGGVNTVGNGASTKAERNCFYHLNIVRQLASKNIDDATVNGFFSRTTPATVNINSNCNAFFDGSGVNFYQAGSGCNNTGEIADVMQHEWGHGLDQYTGGGDDGARGEAVGDIVAFLSTHDPRLGPYFDVGDNRGIRNADEAVAGLYSVATIDTPCDPVGGGGNGPLGFEVHCEGGIFSETIWHLAANMRAKLGDVGGWFATERLFFQHLPVSPDPTYVADQTGSSYDAILFIDDDNGDVMDGTPNAQEINDAYLHHGIASTPQSPDTADCTPPVAPALTAVPAMNGSTGLWQVRVTWPDVPGAAQYELYRNDAVGTEADLPVATLFPPAVEFLDDNVTDGVTYRYRLAVFDVRGCPSIDDNRVDTTVGAFLSLSLGSATFDDAAANGNNVADPGEALLLPVTVRNDSPVDGTTVVGRLTTTHPGVMITTGTASFGNVPSGTAAPAVTPFSVQLDRTSVRCGEVVQFLLEFEALEGCSRTGFTILVGQRTGSVELVSDTMEVDSGWRVNPNATDDATAGAWVREDPNPTFFGLQPGNDHTPSPGVLCFVTGNAVLDDMMQSSAAADDLDGGCTTLQSPVFDMAGEAGLELAYWRYWLIATEPDDSFLVEISNDGGMNWRTLEERTSSVTPFSEAIFPLDAVLGAPAARVVVRFTVCDRGADSIIESLIDDVRIQRPVWVCEAPEPRPRLSFASTAMDDSMGAGAFGNGNGFVDPGESVKFRFELTNDGNATATTVRGQLLVDSAPVGVSATDPDSAWPDIVPGATEITGMDAPAHFELTVPRAAVACGDDLDLRVAVTYAGPAGTYSVEMALPITVGTTRQIVFFSDDFEVPGDNGWMHGETAGTDDWAHDVIVPEGPTDAPAAHSGMLVWGNDLGGMSVPRANGNYPRNSHNFLQSPALPTNGVQNLRVGYWRWLAVEDGAFDHARVYVNGALVWENPTGANFADTAWTWVEHDVSAITDAATGIQVQFDIESDGGVAFTGWTIDDFQIFVADPVCEGARGCETFPRPAAIPDALVSTGRKDQDGVEFEWPTAIRQPGEHFLLYRGTSPQDLSVNVLPTDFTDTLFDDRNAPDGLYFYSLVLADCDGVEGP